MKKKTIREKYEAGEMSAFELRVYEYQSDVIERLNTMHTTSIIAQGTLIKDLTDKNNMLIRKYAELLGKFKEKDVE